MSKNKTGRSIMNFIDWVKEQAGTLANEVKKFKSQDFLEAITAACALVAAADGTIDSSEKQKMVGFVQRSSELKVFDTSKVVKAFNKYADSLEFDHGIGKMDCMKAIRNISEHDAKELLVRVSCAIGAADGDFDDDEKRVVREICRELSLQPSKFSL